MSQRATLTGSIGVIMARADSQGLYEKVKVNRVTFAEGQACHIVQRPVANVGG